MKTIEKHIEQAKELLSIWQREKDSFANEYSMRDFQQMSEHSKNLIEIIEQVVGIFYYEPGFLSGHNDYRTRDRVLNKTILLKENIKDAKHSEEIANLPKFYKLIEKAETTMLALLKTVEMILNKQTVKKRKKPNLKKYKRKTQKEDWADWKQWAQTEINTEDTFSSESSVFKLKELLLKLAGNQLE